MRITDIPTVWQRRSLILESVPRETIPKARSKGSRSRKKIFRKRKKAVIRIFCFCSWSPFDPTLVNYLELSEDPIPNFRKLMKEYSSGYYKVPSVGAGTANTEFESITGMSLHYFGPGEYPYKSILKETTCESAPYVLKNLGYTAHAVHNNEANFYGRRSIFPNLGFDTFTSAEYMKDENQKNPLGWTKDSVIPMRSSSVWIPQKDLIMYILFPCRDMEIILQNRYWKIRRSQFPGHLLTS